jgi:two-component system, NarL family, sensor histidine kinase DesK
MSEPHTAIHGHDDRSATAQWYYLAFLSMLLFQPVFDPNATTLSWVVTAGAILVFAPLYVAVQRHDGALRRAAPWLTVALAVSVFWFNGGATVFLVYAAAFVGTFRPRPVAYRWFAGLSAITVAMGFVAPIPLGFALLLFAFPIFFIWMVGIASIEEAEQWQEAQRLRVDNARIGHLATAAERERIARDLHDVLGQSLTEIIVRAQLARRLAGQDSGATAREIAEIERASRTALDEVRAVVRGWREVRLDEEIETARRSLTAAGIDLRLDHDRSFDPAPTAETALALVLREAVTNVVRHAGASRCTLRLHRDGGQDVIEIADDGDGGIEREGAGLLGMRERVLALGGTFAYGEHDGVRVTVRVPTGIAA